MNAALLSTVAGTVTQGRVAAREAGRLAGELLRISLGSSTVAPARNPHVNSTSTRRVSIY